MANAAFKISPLRLAAFELDFADLMSGAQSGHMGPYLYQDFGEATWAHVGENKNYYIHHDEEVLIKQIVEECDLTASTVLELGPGQSQAVLAKTFPILKKIKPNSYTAADLNNSFVQAAADVIGRHAGCQVDGITGDIFELLPVIPAANTLIIMHGNTLANMPTPFGEDVQNNLRQFFKNMHKSTGRNSKLLISFDQTTNEDKLRKAYDTVAGAELIKSVFYNASAIKAASLSLNDFDYRGSWLADEKRYALEMVTNKPTRVITANRTQSFEAGHAFHITNSFRYSTAEIRFTAEQAGWNLRQVWDIQQGSTYALLETAS